MNRVVPVLTVEEMDRFHFGSESGSTPTYTGHHLFHINKLESYVDKLTFPLPPHRKITFDFLFITKGETVRSKGLTEFKIIPNQFFFLPAYQITEHRSMSTDIEGFYVHFSLDIFQEESLHKVIDRFGFLGFLSNPIIGVDSKAKNRIQRLLADLLDIYTQMTARDHQLVVFNILNVLAEANRFAKEEPRLSKSAGAFLVNQYKDSLSQRIYQLQKVSEYADVLSVTPNHLNKCVKQITNKTAQELLNEMLIMEAKSLLKYTNLQVAEVAVRLCNQNPSNFSRFFKSQTGSSPKSYQNS
jgi:AraC family transcriptional regulator, transcriptional activator of pobA